MSFLNFRVLSLEIGRPPLKNAGKGTSDSRNGLLQIDRLAQNLLANINSWSHVSVFKKLNKYKVLAVSAQHVLRHRTLYIAQLKFFV